MRKWPLSKFLSLSIAVVYLLAVPAYFGWITWEFKNKVQIQEEPYANQDNKKAAPETYSQEKQGPKCLIRWKEPETRAWREVHILWPAPQQGLSNSWMQTPYLSEFLEGDRDLKSRLTFTCSWLSAFLFSSHSFIYHLLSPCHVLGILLGCWGYHK